MIYGHVVFAKAGNWRQLLRSSRPFCLWPGVYSARSILWALWRARLSCHFSLSDRWKSPSRRNLMRDYLQPRCYKTYSVYALRDIPGPGTDVKLTHEIVLDFRRVPRSCFPDMDRQEWTGRACWPSDSVGYGSGSTRDGKCCPGLTWEGTRRIPLREDSVALRQVHPLIVAPHRFVVVRHTESQPVQSSSDPCLAMRSKDYYYN